MRMTRAAILAAIGLMSGAATAPDPNFCERMAPQIGLKRVEIMRRTGTDVEWRVNTASFGQHLVGGTVMTRISVDPVDGAAGIAEKYRALKDMCVGTKKGAECHIVGPVVLTIGTRRGEAKLTALPGERATAGVRGTTVYCRPG